MRPMAMRIGKRAPPTNFYMGGGGDLVGGTASEGEEKTNAAKAKKIGGEVRRALRDRR